MNASPEHRAAMIRLAIAANVAFALDESDLAADATGYTADLLPRLQARHRGAVLTFVVGGDSLVRSRWKRLDEVVDMVEALRRRAARRRHAQELDTRWPTSSRSAARRFACSTCRWSPSRRR